MYGCVFVCLFACLQLCSSFDLGCYTANSCLTCSSAKCTWCMADAQSQKCGNAADMLFLCAGKDTVTDAFSCPISPASGFGFDETFVRDTVTPMIAGSGATNQAQIQQCLNKAGGSITFVKQYTQVCDQFKSTCSGYIALDTTRNAIIIVYRGSEAFLQYVGQGTSFLQDFTTFAAGGKVISYYNTAFNIMWNNSMAADVQALHMANPSYQLWVFGHSLGGALASLTASYLVNQHSFTSSQVRLVTFGQPRTGNTDYAKAVTSLLPYRFRIVHNKDLVPHVPPMILTNSPFHSTFEVWYPNNMVVGASYSLCTQPEDKHCSDSSLDLSTSDHNNYYNVDLTSWFQTGCA